MGKWVMGSGTLAELWGADVCTCVCKHVCVDARVCVHMCCVCTHARVAHLYKAHGKRRAGLSVCSLGRTGQWDRDQDRERRACLQRTI